MNAFDEKFLSFDAVSLTKQLSFYRPVTVKPSDMKKIILPLLLLALNSCQYFEKPVSEPVVVVAPPSQPGKFETSDSSFLQIKIQKEQYEVLFLKDTLTIKSIGSLDSFLQKNKSVLNKDKVFVSGLRNFGKIGDFRKLLLKNGISTFRIDTE